MGFVGGPKPPVARRGAMKMSRHPGVMPSAGGAPRPARGKQGSFIGAKPTLKPPGLSQNIPVSPTQPILPIPGFNPNQSATRPRKKAPI